MVLNPFVEDLFGRKTRRAGIQCGEKTVARSHTRYANRKSTRGRTPPATRAARVRTPPARGGGLPVGSLRGERMVMMRSAPRRARQRREDHAAAHAAQRVPKPRTDLGTTGPAD